MPTPLLMPALSPTMEEGTLAKWLVKEGDSVSSGDLLAEIETDKAVMEFESVDDGIVGKILVPEGSEGIKVNEPIAILVEDASEVGEISLADESQAADDKPKATTEAAASVEKVLEPAQDSRAAQPSGAASARIFASPLAKRIAQSKGVDISLITGSGPRGRIVKADVEKFEGFAPAPARSVAPPPGFEAIVRPYEGREQKVIQLDGMRRTIAARLTEAKQTIPHFYLRRDIRIDKLLAVRAEMNAALAARNMKFSVNDFIIKAGAAALQSVPEANSIWAADRIVQFNSSDVAVAVAVDGGLFTPVIFDADKKPLSRLSSEMKDLAERARNRSLKPNEYQGGSFAISNLGMYGIDSFDAVINPPHGSILAVGTGVNRPVAVRDEIEIATVMSVTLSVDHRVIDGALGARFLASIVENLENPLLMLA